MLCHIHLIQVQFLNNYQTISLEDFQNMHHVEMRTRIELTRQRIDLFY